MTRARADGLHRAASPDLIFLRRSLACRFPCRTTIRTGVRICVTPPRSADRRARRPRGRRLAGVGPRLGRPRRRRVGSRGGPARGHLAAGHRGARPPRRGRPRRRQFVVGLGGPADQVVEGHRHPQGRPGQAHDQGVEDRQGRRRRTALHRTGRQARLGEERGQRRPVRRPQRRTHRQRRRVLRRRHQDRRRLPHRDRRIGPGPRRPALEAPVRRLLGRHRRDDPRPPDPRR